MTFILSLLLSILLISNGAVMMGAQENTNDSIACTILYNNVSVADSIAADHGFSCLIESGDNLSLFDAGRVPDKFMTNVAKLDVDCSRIGQVFISHIHGDHMGGLLDILAECKKPTLYLPFSYPQMKGEPLGPEADRGYKAMLDGMRPLVSEIVEAKEPVTVGDRFYSTGMIEDETYEHALIVPTSKGLLIITGCAHPGILEIVKRAKELMKQDVHFVMGGFHLIQADSTQITTIAQELRTMTKYVGPCHCTGETARNIFKDIFGDDYADIRAGQKLAIDDGKLK